MFFAQALAGEFYDYNEYVWTGPTRKEEMPLAGVSREEAPAPAGATGKQEEGEEEKEEKEGKDKRAKAPEAGEKGKHAAGVPGRKTANKEKKAKKEKKKYNSPDDKAGMPAKTSEDEIASAQQRN